MLFETRRRRRVREALEQPFPAGWRVLLQRRWPLWTLLSAHEQARMESLIQAFVAGRRWEAAQGFDIGDEVRVLVAAQASLLVLELGDEYYTGVGTIIVHPSTVVLHGQRATGTQGLVSDDAFAIDGQAHFGGPIIIAWDAAAAEARHPSRGQNVIFHEFAHKLDMLTGTLDGTPPLDDDVRARWVKVCTREFRAIRAGLGGNLLRSYGGENPAEFFAVATEVFFTRPVEMRADKPDLYDVFCGFYRQDPASRFPTETTIAEPAQQH